MNSTPRLGVLDFCHVSKGADPVDSLWDTIELVRRVEEFGYSRYWISEHHGSGVAHASPECLIPVLAGMTETMRIGAAGILLRYYSPLKVANDFRLLHSLYPNRIDLGLARAGTHPEVERLLLGGRRVQEYGDQVRSLLRFLRGTAEVAALPLGTAPPEIWLLGSNVESMQLAADNGTAFCLGAFIASSNLDLARVLAEYRDRFQPSPELPEPLCAIAFAGVCADTEQEAAQAVKALEFNARPTISGTAERCRDLVNELRVVTGVEEFIFADINTELKRRVDSYQRLADALGLNVPNVDGGLAAAG